MKNVEQIRQRFETRAARYDNPLTSFIGQQELQPVRALIPAGTRVLDYGCGTGRTTLDLVQRGCAVTAYDLAPAMLALAVGRLQRAGHTAEWVPHARQLAGRQWPYVACIGVLDYYQDLVPLLRTLAGHLAPEGTLVVTAPNALSPLAWLYALGSRFTVPAQPCTLGSLRMAASQAGLALSARHYAFPAAPIGLTLVAALVHAA